MSYYNDFNSMDEFEEKRKMAFEAIDNYYTTLIRVPIKHILSNPDYFIRLYLDISYKLSELIIELANENIPLTVQYLQKINFIQELDYLLAQKIVNEYKDLSKQELKKIINYVKETVNNKLKEYENNIELN